MDTLWIIAPCILEGESIAAKSQHPQKPLEDLHHIKTLHLSDLPLHLLPHQPLHRRSNPQTSDKKGASPYRIPPPLSMKPPVFLLMSNTASTGSVPPLNITMKNNTPPGPGNS